ncbi:preprotein translocase subunit YajC [Flindersiella endophytica]
MLLQAAAQGGQAGFNPLTLALPILLLVFFWFVMIRPQRKRQQEAARMQNDLQPGQEVMTAAGLYGTIESVDEDVVVLETSPGVTQRYTRRAIVQVVTPVDQSADESEATTTDGSVDEVTDPTADSPDQADTADKADKTDR